jgi:hypothetical protein
MDTRPERGDDDERREEETGEAQWPSHSVT